VVAHEAGRTLDARDVIAGEGLLLRPPLPEGCTERIERIAPGALAQGKQRAHGGKSGAVHSSASPTLAHREHAARCNGDDISGAEFTLFVSGAAAGAAPRATSCGVPLPFGNAPLFLLKCRIIRKSVNKRRAAQPAEPLPPTIRHFPGTRASCVN
jgi:hypothetical protein